MRWTTSFGDELLKLFYIDEYLLRDEKMSVSRGCRRSRLVSSAQTNLICWSRATQMFAEDEFKLKFNGRHWISRLVAWEM